MNDSFKCQDQECECLKKSLAEKYACFVLITCDKPAADGTMQVEMDYSGDVTLASYLLKEAQEILDEETDDDDLMSSYQME